MRLGSFNVENLFERPKALNLGTWAQGRPILAAHARLNELIQNDPYSEQDRTEMLALLDQLGLLRSDTARFVRLRRIRGAFLRRPRTGDVSVVATGRTSWIGWVELITEPITQRAMEHTAMVIRDVGADVLAVVEAESRPLLQTFTSTLLDRVGGSPYDQVMLIDGNDDRGIDVGLLTRPGYPIVDIRTHIFDVDAIGPVFSRDCAEYHLDTPEGERVVVLVNHLKSKGYGSPGDATGAKRRRRQALRVAEIYHGLRDDGIAHIAVVGDLNDDPSSAALAPLLETELRDISTHEAFDYGTRRGTFQGENETGKIDYVLMSPALFARARGGAVFRKGVYRGPRTRTPWEIYPTLTEEVHAASDHAAIYADIDL